MAASAPAPSRRSDRAYRAAAARAAVTKSARGSAALRSVDRLGAHSADGSRRNRRDQGRDTSCRPHCRVRRRASRCGRGRRSGSSCRRRPSLRASSCACSCQCGQRDRSPARAWRATRIIISVCSATDGALARPTVATMTPLCVAASISMLSTPTPCRDTSCEPGDAAMTARSILRHAHDDRLGVGKYCAQAAGSVLSGTISSISGRDCRIFIPSGWISLDAQNLAPVRPAHRPPDCCPRISEFHPSWSARRATCRR